MVISFLTKLGSDLKKKDYGVNLYTKIDENTIEINDLNNKIYTIKSPSSWLRNINKHKTYKIILKNYIFKESNTEYSGVVYGEIFKLVDTNSIVIRLNKNSPKRQESFTPIVPFTNITSIKEIPASSPILEKAS